MHISPPPVDKTGGGAETPEDKGGHEVDRRMLAGTGRSWSQPRRVLIWAADTAALLLKQASSKPSISATLPAK